MEEVKDDIAGNQPTIGEPPSTEVQLFRGVWVEGAWHRVAHVRELTGADEEGISRMLGERNAIGFVNAMVVYGVESIGTHDLINMGVAERSGIIDMLLVGEKELLFLNVLRVTYGDQRTVGIRCPMDDCGAMNDVSFSLSKDIPIRQLEDATRDTYEFDLRNGGHLEYRLVTGADQAEAAKKPNNTTPESNTIIFSRVIITVNGKPLVDPLHFARNLGALDRRNLLKELTSKQPGPYFEEVKLPCATCGAQSTFLPQWADLL
jgi:hypothetical protein